jgi:N-acetylglucosamine kinase-like BadF-type ATPase
MTEYFLAADGGGTKTKVVCVDETGKVIGKGGSGPTSLTVTSVGAASFNLVEAIRQAVEGHPEITHFKAIVIGLAGVDTPKEQARAEEVFKRALSHYHFEQFVLVNDSVIALENGTDNPNALILVSGTGSICYGRSDTGAVARTAGMDYLLADQGSGYSIGRKVLLAAVESYDGRGLKTVLEEKVCSFYMISAITELKHEVYNPDLTKSEIARLAPLCTEAVTQGDPVAQRILDEEIAELVKLAATVLRKVHTQGKPFDCVFAGAVLLLDSVSSAVREQLTAQFSNLNFVKQDKDPVFGAVKMGIRLQSK